MREEQIEYWFNTHTGQVETGKQTLALYRLGPFATKDEAERAPQIIADRAKAWRDEEQEND